MYLLLSLLLLPSALAGPPQGPPELLRKRNIFVIQHTYALSAPFSCNNVMNNILPVLKKKDCKSFNSFILVGSKYQTTYDDVDAVCTKGINKGGGKFESTKKFFVVDCDRSRTSGTKPPDCAYNPLVYSAAKKVVITCEKNIPVHFNHPKMPKNE